MARGRPMKEEGGDAGPEDEVRSEERDATEPGESSQERAHGGAVHHGMHHMQHHPHHRMQHHGNIHRKDGGGISDGIDDGEGFHPERGTHKPEGSESDPQEKKHGGRMMRRAHGGAIHHDGKKEEHKRHKRAKGGKVPGKAAKSHPGRRARGGVADLNPYTAAGKMTVPDYEHLKTGPDERGGVGPDNRGLTGRS